MGARQTVRASTSILYPVYLTRVIGVTDREARAIENPIGRPLILN